MSPLERCAASVLLPRRRCLYTYPDFSPMAEPYTSHTHINHESSIKERRTSARGKVHNSTQASFLQVGRYTRSVVLLRTPLLKSGILKHASVIIVLRM